MSVSAVLWTLAPGLSALCQQSKEPGSLMRTVLDAGVIWVNRKERLPGVGIPGFFEAENAFAGLLRGRIKQ